MGKRMVVTQNKISLKVDAYNISKIYRADPLILGKSMVSEVRRTGVWLIAILVQIFKVNSSKIFLNKIVNFIRTILTECKKHLA